MVNPHAIVEVLPDLHPYWDWKLRRDGYAKLATLCHFVLIGQEAPTVARFDRTAEGGWRRTDLAGLATNLHLETLGLTVSLGEIYARVFPPSSSA